jgi:hypothetical protein
LFILTLLQAEALHSSSVLSQFAFFLQIFVRDELFESIILVLIISTIIIIPVVDAISDWVTKFKTCRSVGAEVDDGTRDSQHDDNAYPNQDILFESECWS